MTIRELINALEAQAKIHGDDMIITTDDSDSTYSPCDIEGFEITTDFRDDHKGNFAPVDVLMITTF